MKCWAAALGTCSGGHSGEHYVSAGIFDGELVTAFGLPWCSKKPISIGLSSAVSKILCRGHNAQFSEYDGEAAKLSRFLIKATNKTPLEHQSLDLDGAKLERWALKTTLNLGFIGGLDPETHKRLLPPEHLVRAIFEGARIQDGCGLYSVTGSVMVQNHVPKFTWHGIRNLAPGGGIVGMTFTLNQLRFVVSVVPIRAEPLIEKMGQRHGVDYSGSKTTYRPRKVILKGPKAGRKEIRITW